MIVLTGYYSDGEIKEDYMGGTYGGEEKCVQGFHGNRLLKIYL
jgi:hypothetical protein